LLEAQSSEHLKQIPQRTFGNDTASAKAAAMVYDYLISTT
jgi:hypothetical protein